MSMGDYIQIFVWVVVCIGTVVGYRHKIESHDKSILELRADLLTLISNEEHERKNEDGKLWVEHHRLSDRIYNHVDGHKH